MIGNMKNKNFAANVSMAMMVVFVALSFGFGTKQYKQANEEVVSCLNTALQAIVKQHSVQWLNTDTIQAYAHLEKAFGSPILIHSLDKEYADALPEDRLKRNAGIEMRIKRISAIRSEAISSDYIASDTMMIVNSAAVSRPTSQAQTITIRGYAYCPFMTILMLSNQTLPISLLAISLLFGGLSIYLRRKERIETAIEHKDIIIYGDLFLSISDHCIYDLQHQRISLTPMEYTLMEMFYKSSAHFLLKKDICDSLWPGKDNADESLYALIRRLKQTLNERSNVKISAVRGRAYQLDVNKE